MAMSNNSPAMMRGSYSSQMSQVNQSGGQGIQQAVSDSSQIQSHPHPQRNTAFLCKAGCETVQEIVVRTNEVFTHLKNVPLPNGTNQGSLSNEKKLRAQENLNAIQRHFKTLRAIYARVNDDCAGMEYTHIEEVNRYYTELASSQLLGATQSLIPYKDEDTRADHKKMGENYRLLMEESRELKEQLYLKARYMKDIIDQLRKIIWEVNTMLAMSNT